MLKKRLELLFLIMIFAASFFLFYNYAKKESFMNNELPSSYKKRLENKEQEVLANMRKHFGFAFQVPLIVTDEFKGRLFGLTAYQNGEVKIYLNKKVMQESMDYMVDSVIAHEYAHAFMMKRGYLREENDGHSDKWQEVCKKLGGDDCQRYVDSQEIIMSKMPFR